MKAQVAGQPIWRLLGGARDRAPLTVAGGYAGEGVTLEALGRVQTGGHFFGDAHTLERYSTAFYQPMLSNWQNYEAWQEAGGLDATARATRLWKKALDEYEQPPMQPSVREELEAYVARRRQEIGDGEP